VLPSCILAEICVISLLLPPSRISDFRFYLGVLLIAPLKTPKTWVAVEILFKASQNAEIPLGVVTLFNTNVIKIITFDI